MPDIAAQTKVILSAYVPEDPFSTAEALRAFWLSFEPKSMAGIKAEQRALQETAGIPVPVLQAIGQEIAKIARKQVDAYLPLARLLWEQFGREGRVVTVYPLGAGDLTPIPAFIAIISLFVTDL